MLENKINKMWYEDKNSILSCLLLPFSFIFRLVIFLRRTLYHLKIFRTQKISVPVIVVGNITVGGTGKTPFVIWLANFLKSLGFYPGVISRGFGGSVKDVHFVEEKDEVTLIGDEAKVIKRGTNSPFVIGKQRRNAINYLLSQAPEVNIVISDDGLQHYALSRDMEIVLIDGKRRFGNKKMLPAGPLREPLSRLRKADLILINDRKESHGNFYLSPIEIVALNQNKRMNLSELKDKSFHAIAGIGNPQNFFDILMNQGIKIIPHIFPDHHQYTINDLHFNDDLPIIMTEKDAVKCFKFGKENTWYVRSELIITEDTKKMILKSVMNLEKKNAKTEIE